MKAKTASKQSKKTKKLPSFLVLCKRTFDELATFWKPILGVTLIYAVLHFVLVMGLTVSYSYDDIAQIVEDIGAGSGWFGKNVLTIANLFSYSNQADATAIVQAVLFLVATLALIWTLRRARKLKHIRLRDAYYDGPSRIVPFALVCLALLMTFIPAIVGSSIINIALATNSSGIELLFVSLLSGVLLFSSVYWFFGWLPAAFIVSLPESMPIESLRASTKLTHKRRLWMIRNCLLFGLASVLIVFSVMLLFVTIVPAASVIAAFVTTFVLFTVWTVFFYVLYRGLIDGE